MRDRIPVCDKCGKICKEGEFIEHDFYEFGGFYVSGCCNGGITYFGSIKEIILTKLE